jgi:hypothetical protein
MTGFNRSRSFSAWYQLPLLISPLLVPCATIYNGGDLDSQREYSLLYTWLMKYTMNAKLTAKNSTDSKLVTIIRYVLCCNLATRYVITASAKLFAPWQGFFSDSACSLSALIAVRYPFFRCSLTVILTILTPGKFVIQPESQIWLGIDFVLTKGKKRSLPNSHRTTDSFPSVYVNSFMALCVLSPIFPLFIP